MFGFFKSKKKEAQTNHELIFSIITSATKPMPKIELHWDEGFIGYLKDIGVGGVHDQEIIQNFMKMMMVQLTDDSTIGAE